MLHPRVAIAGVLVMLTLAAHPAVAGHCTRFTTSVTGDTQVVLDVDGAYVVGDRTIARAFVYEESNGIPGLQRADAGRDDTCHGQIAGDLRTL